MSLLQTVISALGQGIDLVAEAGDLVELPGMPGLTRDLRLAHAALFGPTRATRKQAAARAAAAAHTLETIVVVERHAARLPQDHLRWQFRARLYALPARGTDFAKAARAELRRLRERPEPRPGVRIYRRASGMWTLAVTGPSAEIAQMWSGVRGAKDRYAAFRAHYDRGGATVTQLQTNVIIELDEFTQVRHGAGDEIVLRMTNGATMTGAQYVQGRLAETGLVTLIHPVEGPVNLYRTSRFANEKQRLMAWAENPTCAVDGCNIPAEESQIHHLQAWNLGGETNSINLATCCPYHNGVNDDDGRMGRARLERREGKIVWRPPWEDYA